MPLNFAKLGARRLVAVLVTFSPTRMELGLADFEHLRAAVRALALGCGAAVLHRDLFRVGHFALGLALHAVGFHTFPLDWP